VELQNELNTTKTNLETSKGEELKLKKELETKKYRVGSFEGTRIKITKR